jgi:hypothetical protein
MAYFVWFLLFVAVSGILFSTASADRQFFFEIQPNAVTSTGVTFGGNVELPNTLCKIKTTTEGFDKNGKVVLTEQSDFFDKHPITTYSLVGGESKSEITKFVLTPKIRCEFIDGNYVPMTVKVANLKAFVMAKDSKGNNIEVWNGIQTTKDVPIVFNHEEEFTKYTVNTSDLFKYMEKGQYETFLTFQLTGTLDMIYTGYDTVHYAITIPRDSVINKSIAFSVTKDTQSTTTTTTSGGDSQNTDPKVPKTPDINPIIDDLQKLSLCVTTADVPCLTQQDYIPYYIGGLGFVFLIGAMTTRNHPVFDSYGNRMR